MPFSRSAAETNNVLMKQYAGRLCCILEKDFGMTMIQPIHGERYNAELAERRRSDMPAEGRVWSCIAPGWRFGDQVLLRAVVDTVR